MGQCFAIIAPDEIGALEFLGKFNKVLMPGCHCMVPGSSVRKTSTRIVENRVQISTKTKDNVFVTIHVSVQQEVFVEKAYDAFYKLQRPEDQIDGFVQDVVRGHVPTMGLDELFEAKDTLANEVKDRLVKGMQEYGFHILEVLVVDIEPDANVKRSMNEINAARRMRMAAQETAEADKIVTIKKAEGEKALLVMQAEAEAQSKFLHGQGVARSRKALVDGLKQAVAGDHQSQMTTAAVQELLIVTQYLDTLEKISSGQSSTVFMPHSISNLATVQEQVRQALSESTKKK